MSNSTPETPDTTKVVDLNTLGINEIIASYVTKTPDGKYSGMDTLDIDVNKKLAVETELRRRNTEASYTKSQQALREKEVELEALRKLVPPSAALPKEEQEELARLKYSDPDAWFDKVTAAKATVSTISLRAVEDLRASEEIVRRANVLAEFNRSNPANPLTDEQLQLYIPPILAKQVTDGSLSFDDMLVKAHAFINGTKVVRNPTYIDEPSFDGVAKGTEPTGSKSAFDADYAKTIF